MSQAHTVHQKQSRMNHMKKFGKPFLYLIGFGLLAIAVVPLTSHPSTANSPLPVIVSNTPLPVQLTPGQPYQDACQVVDLGNLSCAFHSVPAGMRLVIQEVDSKVVSAPGTSAVGVEVGTLLAKPPLNAILLHEFPLTNQGELSGEFYQSTHQPTTLYADHDTGSPNCLVEATPGDVLEAGCAISGYLVPAQ